MRQANGVLDVIDFEPAQPDAEVAQLVAARDAARSAKDFSRADALRAELRAKGVELTDSPSGTSWKKKA
jgi:cysteinyl-tRNA synthetase